jgi:hypothetical protein
MNVLYVLFLIVFNVQLHIIVLLVINHLIILRMLILLLCLINVLNVILANVHYVQILHNV